MKEYKYNTPVVEDSFIPCDWNEGDNLIDTFAVKNIDRYIRSDLEKVAIELSKNILSIPKSLNIKLTSGSDLAIMITILYASKQNYNKFRMRENDYAQVKAFASTSFENLEIVDDDLIFKLIDENSIVYFSNPGNPNCRLYSEKEIYDVVSNNPKSFFIVDLAYIEFSGNFNFDEFLDLPNLVFIRTFSKYWGIAGARLGALIFGENCIFSPLYEVFNSKHLSQQHLALLESLSTNKEEIIKIRKKESLNIDKISSHIKTKFKVSAIKSGNFIRFDCKNIDSKNELWNYFISLKILARDLSHLPSYKYSVRLSYRDEAFKNIFL